MLVTLYLVLNDKGQCCDSKSDKAEAEARARELEKERGGKFKVEKKVSNSNHWTWH